MLTGVPVGEPKPGCLEVGAGVEGVGKISMGEPGRYRVSTSHQQREGLGSDKVFSMVGPAFVLLREVGVRQGGRLPGE